MLLHDAIKKARKDLGLSQKKLAEMAGIQRRQLATLESGGNVTLATIRKVIAHLPNLESFTLDAVRVDVTAASAHDLADDLFSEALSLISAAMAQLAARTRDGALPGPAEVAALKKANEILQVSLDARELATAIAMQEMEEEGEEEGEAEGEAEGEEQRDEA